MIAIPGTGVGFIGRGFGFCGVCVGNLISGRREVSKTAKSESKRIKRMNLNVPVELHNCFKSVTAAQGQNMTDVLLEFIQNYIAKYSPKPKGRRK